MYVIFNSLRVDTHARYTGDTLEIHMGYPRKHGQTVRQTDSEAYRQADRQTDSQTDKQTRTHTHTNRQIHTRQTTSIHNTPTKNKCVRHVAAVPQSFVQIRAILLEL